MTTPDLFSFICLDIGVIFIAIGTIGAHRSIRNLYKEIRKIESELRKYSEITDNLIKMNKPKG